MVNKLTVGCCGEFVGWFSCGPKFSCRGEWSRGTVSRKTGGSGRGRLTVRRLRANSESDAKKK